MENLPDEIILEICSNLETSDLLNIIKTSSHFEQICNEVLTKRINQLEEKLLNTLNKRYQKLSFRKKYPGLGIIKICIYRPGMICSGYNKIVNIYQEFPKNIKKYSSWILPSVKPKFDKDFMEMLKSYIRQETTIDQTDPSYQNLIRELATNLILQGFIEFQS